MGVTGLWRLIDASGKPVPLESLEGKVLAIDVSIWIHQVLQGYQDKRGNSLPNAHLLGLYNRICKLLYFKIKPVFVFDGGVPLLKKNTIAARKKQKALASCKAERMKSDLLLNLMKHSLVKNVLTKKAPGELEGSTSKPLKTVNDMFKLPMMPPQALESSSDDTDSDSDDVSPRKQSKWRGNIHTVDITSDDFKNLPPDVRYDILTDLKETRKQNSWARLHEIPEESNQFSNYQMTRLLKRRQAQELLEATEQEMGGKNLTLEELETLMSEQGVDTTSRDLAYRIASDAVTRVIYINDPKRLTTRRDDPGTSSDLSQPSCSRELDQDEGLTVIPEEPSSVVDDMGEYDLDWDSDVEVISSPVPKRFFGKVEKNPALNYMENNELSQEQLLALIEESKLSVKRAKAEERTKRKFPGEGGLWRKRRRSFDIEDIIGVKEEVEEVTDGGDYGGDFSEEKALIGVGGLRGLSEDSESDDSGDFVEVQDVETPEFKPEKKMEIVIKVGEGVGDDLFADVFEGREVPSGLGNGSSGNEEKIEKIQGPQDLSRISNRKSNIENEEVKVCDEKEEIEVVNSEGERTGKIGGDDLKKLTTFNVPKKIVGEDKKNAEERGEIASQQTADDETSEESPEDFERQIRPSDSSGSQENLQETDVTTTSTTKNDQNFAEPSGPPPKVIELPEDHPRRPSDRITSVLTRLASEKPELLSKVSNDRELEDLRSHLETETEELKQSIGKLDRQSVEVTEQMRLDAQDLLRLFGIPYVVAPQEAEAQCAYLESINLTDGSITDDSDIWLFGAKCVYRNFFNNAKKVMQYSSKDIEHHFKLTREQMIQLALLVGSDYTVGIPGIGPVTAMEILASFPAEGDDLLRGLTTFSYWMRGGRIVGPGRGVLRNKLKNINVDRGFPSQAVVQAYLFPTVDESKENFSWGKPNLVLLADYTRAKFGWTRAKFDEIMTPVMKRLEAKSQKDLLAYFKVNSVPKAIEQGLSKRLQKAVERMGKGPGEDDEGEEVVKAPRRKRRPPPKDKGDEQLDEGSIEADANNEEKKVVKPKKEVIPQRERDKQNALDKKLKAIEVFRKSRKGPGKSRNKNARPKRNAVQREAKLSESSSDGE
ncbi:DNA repair protein complementing XP-G cells homolog [Diachasma alloeum]|uniref:DNA repair protein complementing XP-G cells homolog n=1 Tax=Diachasma alloeum TaxID=454923 RepID=UPI0007381981|nr:DNA repair protein complementing XP-G cells homolog [Diachasma alloeum]